MPRRQIGWFGLGAVLVACDASSPSSGLVVGEESTGGATGQTEGMGGNDSIGAPRSIDPFGVEIHNPGHVSVELVTLSCPGECVTLEAVAHGGYPPYTYEWSDNSTDATRTFCPGATAEWTVAASDSGFHSPEFNRAPETAHGRVTAEVLACTDPPTRDGGTPSMDSGGASSDGGGPPTSDAATTGDASEPPGDPRVLCSQNWPILNNVDLYFRGLASSNGSVATGGDGSIVIVGSFKGSVDFGGGALQSQGTTDVFVVKLDSDCRHLWSKRFGGRGANLYAGLVVVDAASNVLLAGVLNSGAVDFGVGEMMSPPLGVDGTYLVKLDSNGTALWSRTFQSNAVTMPQVIDTDGENVVLVGLGGSSLDVGGDRLIANFLSPSLTYLAKFTSSGEHVWSRTLPITTTWSMGVAKNGSVALTTAGNSTLDWGGGNIVNYNNSQAIVAKLDDQGRFVWSKGVSVNVPEPAPALPQSLVGVSSAGNISILGTLLDVNSEGTELIQRMAFTSALNPAGTERWQVDLTLPETAQRDLPWRLAVDPTESVTLAGPFAGTIELGPDMLTSAGAADVFVLRLDASGKHDWSMRFGEAFDEALLGMATDPRGNVVTTGFVSENNTLFLTKVGR